MTNLDEFWEEMSRDSRTPEQKAHADGYRKGYFAAEEEQRRKDGLREKFSPDDVTELWEKAVVRKEPLDEEEAGRIWREITLLLEKHHTNGSLLLSLNDQLVRELAKGERCAVCGRYKNPGCAREC
jgi:hypothetical protein